MTSSILITGITGLIGGNVLRAILALDSSFEITALVRPGTSKGRYAEFGAKVEIVELDLADTKGINAWLESRNFDIVMHIGALRGGRKFGKQTYLKANLHSTQAFVNTASRRVRNCSSVHLWECLAPFPKSCLHKTFPHEMLITTITTPRYKAKAISRRRFYGA